MHYFIIVIGKFIFMLALINEFIMILLIVTKEEKMAAISSCPHKLKEISLF